MVSLRIACFCVMFNRKLFAPSSSDPDFGWYHVEPPWTADFALVFLLRRELHWT